MTRVFRSLFRWLPLTAVLALITGSTVALFLWALDVVTALRFATPTLLWFLPAAGALIAVAYIRAGRGVERGSNLVFDAIRSPGDGVPARLTPLVLTGTLVTHLCGGSAGREGTAVQMGGSLASAIDRYVVARLRGAWPLSPNERAVFVQAGIAAGFSAVFGTPLAGAIFALEVLRGGRLADGAVVPCVLAALMADQVTLAWGIEHTRYPVVSAGSAGFALPLLIQVAAAAVCFGLASRLFAIGSHTVGHTLARFVRRPWLRPVVGGVIVVALTQVLGTREYLGLGITSPEPGAVTILSSFRAGGADRWSWLLKGVFTAVTIGSGFKGGEVTPLFFIGAALGNSIAVLFQAPVELFAALGFAAVFAGATKTPIACTIMAVELFGIHAAAYFAVACALAFLWSGRTGVYTASLDRRHVDGLPAGAEVVVSTVQ